jgi:hypothetical protein
MVLSHGIQNPLQATNHPAFWHVQARRRPHSTAHHTRLYHYLRPVPLTLTPTRQAKPIAHAPCSGLVQYIFSSPAWLRSHFLSAYAFCRHAAELKMLCIVGNRVQELRRIRHAVCFPVQRITNADSRLSQSWRGSGGRGFYSRCWGNAFPGSFFGGHRLLVLSS